MDRETGVETRSLEGFRVFSEEECFRLSLPVRSYLWTLYQTKVVSWPLLEDVITEALSMDLMEVELRDLARIVRERLGSSPFFSLFAETLGSKH